jgi:hypothetical protein
MTLQLSYLLKKESSSDHTFSLISELKKRKKQREKEQKAAEKAAAKEAAAKEKAAKEAAEGGDKAKKPDLSKAF